MGSLPLEMPALRPPICMKGQQSGSIGCSCCTAIRWVPEACSRQPHTNSDRPGFLLFHRQPGLLKPGSGCWAMFACRHQEHALVTGPACSCTARISYALRRMLPLRILAVQHIKAIQVTPNSATTADLESRWVADAAAADNQCPHKFSGDQKGTSACCPCTCRSAAANRTDPSSQDNSELCLLPISLMY